MRYEAIKQGCFDKRDWCVFDNVTCDTVETRLTKAEAQDQVKMLTDKAVVAKKVLYSLRELREELHSLTPTDSSKDIKFTSPVVIDIHEDGSLTIRAFGK